MRRIKRKLSDHETARRFFHELHRGDVNSKAERIRRALYGLLDDNPGGLRQFVIIRELRRIVPSVSPTAMSWKLSKMVKEEPHQYYRHSGTYVLRSARLKRTRWAITNENLESEERIRRMTS